MKPALFRGARRGPALALLLALWSPLAPSFAHELAAHRLTLVVQAERSVQAQWHLDWADVLRDLSAPDEAPAGFLFRVASEPASALEAPLARLRALVESQWQLHTPEGEALRIVRWQWPSASELHQALQQQAAQQALGEHVHGAQGPVVRAEAQAPAPVRQLRMSLPAALERALVVSYRPQQRWVEAGAPQTLSFVP